MHIQHVIIKTVIIRSKTLIINGCTNYGFSIHFDINLFREVFYTNYIIIFVSGESKGKPLIKSSRHDSRRTRGESNVFFFCDTKLINNMKIVKINVSKGTLYIM